MKTSQYTALTRGTVYLIGAGPGDPGLITVRGLDVIKAADVIVYDYLASTVLLDEARPDAELIYVGKTGKQHTLEQHQINDLLVERASQGRTVARLKGGDPYVFGRGGEEAEELREAGVRFEVVPGVTSAVAAPAYAGVPVTHRDHASMVTFITGHEKPDKEVSAINWDLLAANPGTLVFLMGVKNLATICSSLITHGKTSDTPALLVRWGTTPAQVTLSATLADLPLLAEQKGMKPPAILVVGSVVGLQQKLGWFENRPLFGKRILITRSLAQSRGMADRIRLAGGEPILFPTIRIDPPDSLAGLDAAISAIATYDWVVFTSVNGVDCFFRRFFELRSDIREMAGPQLGAIGPVTAASLTKLGLAVHAVPKEFVAEGLLAMFPATDVVSKRFLIPRAEQARDVLPDKLIEMGAHVDVAPVYKTSLPNEQDTEVIVSRLRERSVDAVTFTSSSTVNHFLELLGDAPVADLLEGVLIASIGPITSHTIRSHGLEPQVEAQEYTIDGLLAALEAQFAAAGA